MATIGAAGFGLPCMIGARVNSSVAGVLLESLQEQSKSREVRVRQEMIDEFIFILSCVIVFTPAPISRPKGHGFLPEIPEAWPLVDREFSCI